jgi:hypothetical protein
MLWAPITEDLFTNTRERIVFVTPKEEGEWIKEAELACVCNLARIRRERAAGVNQLARGKGQEPEDDDGRGITRRGQALTRWRRLLGSDVGVAMRPGPFAYPPLANLSHNIK